MDLFKAKQETHLQKQNNELGFIESVHDMKLICHIAHVS